MRAIIREFVTGHYGKTGLKLVNLNKIVRFKNGNINNTATLKNGYMLLEVIKPSYGFGRTSESIVKILED